MEATKKQRRREETKEEASKKHRRRREDAKKEASSEPNELPPEMIGEILIRLPAKSIGRFRCVSKLFRSLSSDQRFARRHLDLTVRNDSAWKLLVSSNNLYALDFDSIIGDGTRDVIIAVELDYPFKDAPSILLKHIKRLPAPPADRGGRALLEQMSKSRNCVQVVGSCNGLVCISPGEGEGAMFLYNPTTGESKRLPETAIHRRYEDYVNVDALETYGFGFDDLTNDYKVVKLVAPGGGEDLLSASVYSLKANSWRRTRDLRYQHKDGFSFGVNLNGACHWVFAVRDEGGDHHRRVVLAFDFKTEEFREMPLPEDAEDRPHGMEELVAENLNGRLAVVNRCLDVHDDIWVMNEYGVASSWSRIQISLSYRSMKPLCCYANKSVEVLLQLDEDVVLYNFQTNEWRKRGIRGVELGKRLETNTYVESLVSPNSYGFHDSSYVM